jgi:hypothetical protein
MVFPSPGCWVQAHGVKTPSGLASEHLVRSDPEHPEVQSDTSLEGLLMSGQLALGCDDG